MTEKKPDSLEILNGTVEFEVIDERALTKMVCKFVGWSHNNKRVILKDMDTNKNISVDGKSFLEFIGFFD